MFQRTVPYVASCKHDLGIYLLQYLDIYIMDIRDCVSIYFLLKLEKFYLKLIIELF